MEGSSKNPAWEMVQALTRGRLVVPPLGAVDPDQVEAFGKWHWATRELDRMRELYLFDVEAVARDIVEHGPLFSLSHGGHGINSYALTLVTTAPSGDVAFFTQGGLWGGYSDEERDIAEINAAYQRLAHEWAEPAEDGQRSERVRWLLFSSELRGDKGIVDLDALRGGADAPIERLHTLLPFGDLFERLKARRAG